MYIKHRVIWGKPKGSFVLIKSVKYQITQQFWNTKIVTYFIIACSFLSGYGVYLGRYLRFNTWDVISDPYHLLQEIWNSLYVSKTWVITLSFGWLIYILFFFTISNTKRLQD